MKAIAQAGYEAPIRARATSVNTPDSITAAGVPYIVRLRFGLWRPPTPGDARCVRQRVLTEPLRSYILVGMLTQETSPALALGRTYDPQGTRARLVENAFREIHAHGYAGASLARILANSGVTKGALYHHFKSKADLLHAVIDDAILPMVVERWLQPLQESDDPIRALAESTRAMMDNATPEEMHRGCPLNNLTQELAGADEDFRKHLDRIADDWRAGIRAAFERGQEAGSVRKDVDPAAVASLVFATYQGLIGSVKTSRDQEAVTAGLSIFLDLLEGLRP